MGYVVESGTEPRQAYVAVRATVRMSEMGEQMGPLFARLFGWLGQAGIEATGAPWARYLTVGPDEVELEIGAPVGGEVAGSEGIVSGVRPACDVAWTVHVGPYDQMEPAYKAVISWITENGRMIAGAGWEFYETDPDQEPDPAKWRTRIVFPLAPVTV